MNEFLSWLSEQQCSPSMVEAIQTAYCTLCESLTPADIRLGKYLKGMNGDVKVPHTPSSPIPGGHRSQLSGAGLMKEDEPKWLDSAYNRDLTGTEIEGYVTLARNHKLVGQLLAIGSKTSKENEDQARESVIETMTAAGQYVNGSTAEHIVESMHVIDSDRPKLAEISRLYMAGKSDEAFMMLHDNVSGFKFAQFVRTVAYCIQYNMKPNEDRRYMYMDTNQKKSLIRNKWLIHGTTVESGMNIIKNGFDRGNKIGDLAYNDSTAVDPNMKHDYSGDYLFAFDATENFTSKHYDGYIRARKYGKFLLVFKGSGYKIFHSGDYENQVMFDYHEPKAFFFILDSDRAGKVGLPVGKKELSLYGRGKDGKPRVLISCDEAFQCINWVLKHGDDYVNLMFHPKSN